MGAGTREGLQGWRRLHRRWDPLTTGRKNTSQSCQSCGRDRPSAALRPRAKSAEPRCRGYQFGPSRDHATHSSSARAVAQAVGQ
eukprot:6469652-Amphidinium_carterae.1